VVGAGLPLPLAAQHVKTIVPRRKKWGIPKRKRNRADGWAGGYEGEMIATTDNICRAAAAFVCHILLRKMQGQGDGEQPPPARARAKKFILEVHSLRSIHDRVAQVASHGGDSTRFGRKIIHGYPPGICYPFPLYSPT
jgi:hypothetical protein